MQEGRSSAPKRQAPAPQRRRARARARIVPPPTAPPAPGAAVQIAGSEQKDGYADPFASLGARSPFCRNSEIGARAADRLPPERRDRAPYPLSSYGLDVRVGFSLTKVENNLLGALQSVAALVWMGLVYVLKGVLLLLEWAFSLDLSATRCRA